jgi:hypothetical protein
MKMILFFSAVLVAFSGCASKAKVEYIERYNEVKVPVKCVVPDTKCVMDKNATNTEVIAAMRLCIEEYKRNSEVCK